LKIAVPCREPRLGVEHRDAVTHIVEGDAQLGLALAQLVEEPCVLDRDHRLIGEGGGQLDLCGREGIDARAGNDEDADECLLAQKRNAEQCAGAGDLRCFRIGVFRILRYIGDEDRAALQFHTAGERTTVGHKGMREEECPRLLRKAVSREQVIHVISPVVNLRLVGAAEARHRLHQRLKNGREVDGRAADDLEHVAGRGELVDRAREIGRALAQFLE
jgi:hypothetical protein